jgi:hypothetical protein
MKAILQPEKYMLCARLVLSGLFSMVSPWQVKIDTVQIWLTSLCGAPLMACWWIALVTLLSFANQLTRVVTLFAELGGRSEEQQSVFFLLQPRHSSGRGAHQQEGLRARREYLFGRRNRQHEQQRCDFYLCQICPGESSFYDNSLPWRISQATFFLLNPAIW